MLGEGKPIVVLMLDNESPLMDVPGTVTMTSKMREFPTPPPVTSHSNWVLATVTSHFVVLNVGGVAEEEIERRYRRVIFADGEPETIPRLVPKTRTLEVCPSQAKL